jgi:hypothetical protein
MYGHEVSKIRSTPLLGVPGLRLEGASGLFRLLGSWAGCSAMHSAPSRHRRGAEHEPRSIPT